MVQNKDTRSEKQITETYRVLELLQGNLRKAMKFQHPQNSYSVGGVVKQGIGKRIACRHCSAQTVARMDIHSINADNWSEEHAPTAPGQTILKSIVHLDDWII